jgi:hypothetical protein
MLLGDVSLRCCSLLEEKRPLLLKLDEMISLIE